MKQEEEPALWSQHKMTIPYGQAAKLIRVPDPSHADFRVTEIADNLKFVDPTPVALIAGGFGDRPGKTMAGLCRAAQHKDAVIIDSGV